jgi:hypothetical protein
MAKGKALVKICALLMSLLSLSAMSCRGPAENGQGSSTGQSGSSGGGYGSTGGGSSGGGGGY